MVFHIRGLDCAEEVTLLKGAVGPLVGGEANLDFDVLNAKMTVRAAGTPVTREAVCAAVAQTGMQASPWDQYCATGVCAVDETLWQKHGRLALCTASGIFLALGLAAHGFHAGGILTLLVPTTGSGENVPLAATLCYLAAVLTGGWFIAPKAFYALQRLTPDMNLLMVVAAVGAVILGEFSEAAAVTFLFSLALLLESWSTGRARRAIKALMDLSPPMARVVCPHDGCVEERPVAEVAVGTIFLVRPGERIPLDGIITRGETSVNQGPITGESLPLVKAPGDEVFAGTINGHGAVEVRSSRAAADTMLARIIHLVEAAHARRAPSERWVERFSRRYTPIMMGVALAVAVLPPLAFQGEWSTWFYNGLVVLVIACPCALVISTPVSIVAALACAARNGVLIKGGVFLEAPAHVKVLAFDKTGTLTFGETAVQRITPLAHHTEEELLANAAAMEVHSTHPLGRAILRCAEARGVAPAAAENFVDLPGQGARATIAGRQFWIGSQRLLERTWGSREEVALHTLASDLEDAGHSLVFMWCEHHICGFFSIADQLRAEARSTVDTLKRLGIQRVAMLTGDNRRTAQGMAQAAGVDECHAELLPEDKVELVARLTSEFGHVAMVGDGVNDAPAMAAAGLGIAMGTAGSDAAIETADIALMSDDLAKLPWLVAHSRRTLRIIRANIALALGLKALFLGLAVAGVATLWTAIAADMGASLLVIFNGLRLLKGA
jgi:Cd2+/Zn2+-exporting ATPase